MLVFDEFRLKTLALEPGLADLKQALRVAEAETEATRLEKTTTTDEFWDDMQNSQKVLQAIKQLRIKCETYYKLHSRAADLLTLCEMAIEDGGGNADSLLAEITTEYAAVEQNIESLRLSTLLTGEYDSQSAILSLHAGAGGTEAQDWVQMLYRMYTRWAERQGFRTETLDYQDGEEAGLKSATVAITGENAYGYLKSEGGIHRLVRISPFDASGRRHTSFAAVEVMPDLDDTVQIDIRPEDLRVDTYRSSGAGGQHVNKTESAIRITHIPTGVVVACQVERSQHQNRDTAMRMLRSRLIEIKEREHLDKIEDIKGVKRAIEWGSQIRSYVFMPYTLAKDHRTNFENGNINAVMDGEIDGFINAYLKHNAKG